MMLTLGANITTDAIRDITSVGVEATTKVALIMMPLFILIEFGYAIILYFNNRGDLDLRKFFGRLMLWFCMFQYSGFMFMIEGTVDAMIDTIKVHVAEEKGVPLPMDAAKALNGVSPEVYRYAIEIGTGKMNVASLENLLKSGKITQAEHDMVLELSKPGASTNNQSQAESSQNQSNWFDIGEKIATAFANIPQLIISAVNAGIIWAAGLILEIISSLICGVLLIFGPLALTFNMLPFGISDGVAKNWFSTWLSVKCWVLTLAVINQINNGILDKTIDNFVSVNAKSFIETTTSMSMTGIYSSCIVILILMVPFLTGLYIKGVGGQFMSLATTAATTVASGGASGIGAAGSLMSK